MTDKELKFLLSELRKIKLENIWLCNHIKEKNVTISLDMIIKTIQKDDLLDLIIEYNETPTRNRIERRVLIRSNDIVKVSYVKEDKTTFEKDSNLCFVVCLDNSKIVTAYYNLANDMHDTLMDERYNERLKIIK